MLTKEKPATTAPETGIEEFDAEAQVSKDGMAVYGDSIMGLLMLGAAKGSSLDVETSGPAAADLADAIEALVSDKFGEGM